MWNMVSSRAPLHGHPIGRTRDSGESSWLAAENVKQTVFRGICRWWHLLRRVVDKELWIIWLIPVTIYHQLGSYRYHSCKEICTILRITWPGKSSSALASTSFPFWVPWDSCSSVLEVLQHAAQSAAGRSSAEHRWSYKVSLPHPGVLSWVWMTCPRPPPSPLENGIFAPSHSTLIFTSNAYFFSFIYPHFKLFYQFIFPFHFISPLFLFVFSYFS